MIYQIFDLDALITLVTIFLLVSIAFSVPIILIYLIMNAATWLKQEMKTRRNNKLRRK